MKNVFYLFLVLIVSSILSCTSDTLNNIDTADQSTLKQDRHLVGKNISEMITDYPDLQNQLQELAIKMAKTGYYELEFFLALELDSKITLQKTGVTTLRELFLKHDKQNEALIDRIESRDIGLSILLVNVENNIDFSNRIYVDDIVDEQDENATVQYYVDGVATAQNINDNPGTKIMVVRQAESFLRADEINNTTDKILLGNVKGKDLYILSGLVVNLDDNNSRNQGFCCPCPTPFNNFNLCEWYCLVSFGCTSNGSSASSGSCNEPCERNCKSGKDKIWRFKTTNDHDGWFQGKGEFYPIAVWADDANIVFQNNTYSISGNGLGGVKKGVTTGVAGNNSWYTINANLITWDEIGDGDKMKIAWYERDSGTTFSFSLGVEVSIKVTDSITIKVGEISFGTSKTDNDDEIGEEIVEYCDRLGTKFNHMTGSVTFQMTKDD